MTVLLRYKTSKQPIKLLYETNFRGRLFSVDLLFS